MPTKPAVPEPLVPRSPAQELLYLHLPAVQAVKLADTVRCPAVYSADIAEGSPAEHSVRTAEHSADIAEGSPAEDSVRTAVRTAEDSPAEYSADRKADKGYTEVLPQVRPHL